MGEVPSSKARRTLVVHAGGSLLSPRPSRGRLFTFSLFKTSKVDSQHIQYRHSLSTFTNFSPGSTSAARPSWKLPIGYRNNNGRSGRRLVHLRRSPRAALHHSGGGTTHEIGRLAVLPWRWLNGWDSYAQVLPKRLAFCDQGCGRQMLVCGLSEGELLAHS
jgi:hypothetical protein